MNALLLMAVLAQVPSPAVALNVRLNLIANTIVRQQHLPYRVQVVTPENWRTTYYVNATSYISDDLSEVIIGIGPLLAEDLDAEGLRGLIAHELAHTKTLCGWTPLGEKPSAGDDAEYMACEHRTDVLAAQWVGYRAVFRSLCQTRASSWYWRYVTDASELNERIRLLHQIAYGTP